MEKFVLMVVDAPIPYSPDPDILVAADLARPLRRFSIGTWC